MDHSLANNVMQQKGSFSIPGKRKLGIRKILSTGDAAYRPGRGDGSARRGRSLISAITLLRSVFPDWINSDRFRLNETAWTRSVCDGVYERRSSCGLFAWARHVSSTSLIGSFAYENPIARTKSDCISERGVN